MSALVQRARRRAPRPFDPRLRVRIEAAIDRLIATLDAIDGDTDLEPDDEGDVLDQGELDEAEASDRWRARFGRHDLA